MKLQTGISLLELLIALALSLWLLSGVLLCYLSNQRTDQIEQALAHLQENGRIAAQLLTQDIRTAGYIGCLPLSSIRINQLASFNFNTATRIAGWRQKISTTNSNLPANIANNAILKSDILLIQSMVPENATIISAQLKTIKFTEKPDYKIGDIIVIADCTHADITQVTAINDNTMTVLPALSQPYERISTQTGHLASIFYYIRRTTRKNTAGAPVYALYRTDMNQPNTVAQEVVEGVEDLQLKFGIAHNNAIDYLPVPQLTSADWSAIVSVQVALLLNSIDSVSNRETEYCFNQQSYPATDKLLRQEWHMTTAIREPILPAS